MSAHDASSPRPDMCPQCGSLDNVVASCAECGCIRTALTEALSSRAAAAEQQVARLRKALAGLADLVRQHGEGHSEAFERTAAVFYRETGMLAPGKDSVTDDRAVRSARFDAWVDERIAFAVAALAAPAEPGSTSQRET